MRNSLCIIHWTCQGLDEARAVIKILLEKRLIACANIIPTIESHYIWEGKVESSSEVKVIFKSTPRLFESICTVIQGNASYEVPEITLVQVDQANPPYLEWVLENLWNS